MSEEQMKEQLKIIRELFLPYETILRHPMVAIHSANAAAYHYCCDKAENYETISLYLSNLNDGAASDAMPKLFQKW